MEEAEAPDPQAGRGADAPAVPPPPSSQATPPTPSEAIAAIRIRAPTRGNRKLDQLFDAVNADPQVKAWWHMAGVNAARLGLTDHSWVHIQIVTNIALRLARLLFRRGIVPAMVSDHRMTERDAEVVIAAAALFHCVGMSIHRTDHEGYSLFLTADKLGGLLAGVYDEPERSVVVAEAMHAVISHRSQGRAADDRGRDRPRRGRARHGEGPLARRVRGRAPRHPLDLGLRHRRGADLGRARRRRSASRSRCPTARGSSRSTRGSGPKLRGTPLAEHIEVIARIEGEHEKRLVPVFRL